jgi:hypothetical protein
VAILQRVAESLLAAQDEILAANEQDVAASTGKIDNTLMQRLKLKPAKLQALAQGDSHTPLASIVVSIGLDHIVIRKPILRLSGVKAACFTLHSDFVLKLHVAVGCTCCASLMRGAVAAAQASGQSQDRTSRSAGRSPRWRSQTA